MFLADAALAVAEPSWLTHPGLPPIVAAFAGLCFLFQKPLGEFIASWARRRRGEGDEPVSLARVVRELDQISARVSDLGVRFSEFGRRFAEHATEEAKNTKEVHDGICDFEANLNERLGRADADLAGKLHAIELRLAERGPHRG